MNLRPRIILSLLILSSLLLLIGWCLLEVGYANAGLLKDSQGNQLGFNKPLTLELMQGLAQAAWRVGWHEWSLSAWSLVCAVMHLWGLIWLWRPSCTATFARTWFALQTVFFFPGLLGLLIWPHLLFSPQPWDGETISEPPGIFTTAGPWLLITWAYLFITRRQTAPQPEIACS
jgi:hypothetical protein